MKSMIQKMMMAALILCAAHVRAQTAGDPGEGLRAAVGNTAGKTAISWWGKAGRTYFLQISTTLQQADWTFIPVIESGTNAVITWEMQSSTERGFVRLVYTDVNYTGPVGDADFDGDGVSNAEEIAQSAGTNPFEEDTDGDGLDDKFELDHGLNPVEAQLSSPGGPLVSVNGAYYPGDTAAVCGIDAPGPFTVQVWVSGNNPDESTQLTNEQAGLTSAGAMHESNGRYIAAPIFYSEDFSFLPRFLYVFYTNPNSGKAEVAIADLLPLEMQWEAKSTVPEEDNVGGQIDPWTAQPNGFGIFPDAVEPNIDAGFRRELYLQLQLNYHLDLPIYLKVFDVDDPSSVADPQHILDPTDTHVKKAGDDNITPDSVVPRGYFLPEGAKTKTVYLDVGSLNVEFMVTAQPGNNYRIAAAYSQEDLNMLQVSDHRQKGYVPPNDQPVKGFRGFVSPMLTVWRRLHIEEDSMEAITTPKGSPDRVDAVGDHWAGPDNQRRYVLHLTGNLAGGPEFYRGGKVKQGAAEYFISDNGDNWIAMAQFEPQPSGLIGPIEVFDDDDKGLNSDPLPKIGLVSQGVKNLFKHAYIDIVARTVGNSTTTIPFSLYSDVTSAYFPGGLDNSIDTSSDDSLSFWNHSLIATYQPYDLVKSTLGSPIDGDPDTGNVLSGITKTISGAGPKFSAVFVEAVREQVKTSADIPTDFQKELDHVVAHEIGHVPHDPGGHPEGGLMADGAPNKDFAAESLRRFRTTERWQGQ